MDYKQLKELFSQHEREHPETHLTACITFSSFGSDNRREYSWDSRTYEISSDNKAFRSNQGGYSIFGCCLDGSDKCVRLDHYMREEKGCENGWVVEDCFLVGYLLISSTELSISAPELFYTHGGAVEQMLSQLAEMGELDFEKVKATYVSEDPLEDDWYGIESNSAWLAGQCLDRHWYIQRVYIYSPLKIVFPETERSGALDE